MLKELFHKTNEEKLCNLCDRSSFWSRDLRGIKKLLDNDLNIDINYRDDIGMTPLHYAISNRYIKAVDVLLNYGANPRLPDKHGLSPLGYAFKVHYQKYKEDSKQIVIKLIKSGIVANIMTVKMLISYYNCDDEILAELFNPARTRKGLNRGHMIDVNMLMKFLKNKVISQRTMKLIFAFKPNINTVPKSQVPTNENLGQHKENEDMNKNIQNQSLINLGTSHQIIM